MFVQRRGASYLGKRQNQTAPRRVHEGPKGQFGPERDRGAGKGGKGTETWGQFSKLLD
jgi:hypothetical protein